MNYKKLTAALLTATLVVANCVPAFATDPEGATGTGAVEYDNSVAIEYDQIQVPTIDASYNNTFAFQLDPTDQLHTYDSETYVREGNESNPGVYFHSQKVAASLAPKTGNDFYKKDKVEVTAANYKEAIVTEISGDAGSETYTLSETKYYVWAPKDIKKIVNGVESNEVDTTAKGKQGDYKEITPTNVKNYFDIVQNTTSGKVEVTMKEDHRKGDSVCDGKVYTENYVPISNTLTDGDTNDALNLSKYVTFNSDKSAMASVTGIYKATTDGDTTTYGLAEVSDLTNETTGMTFTPEKYVYQGKSDKITVTNKSTKAKTVKAVVKMSNVSGLDFDTAGTFAGDKAKLASVYFKATDGVVEDDVEKNAKVLTKAEGATEATATFEATVAGASITPITYQGEINSTTGGHNYYNFAANNTSYSSSSFWIEAKANTANNDDAKAAWKTYGESIKAATDKPSINIVYTVTDKDATPIAPTTSKTTFNKSEDGTGVDIVFNKGSYDGITKVMWATENSDSATWKEYSETSRDTYFTIDNTTLKVTEKIFGSSATRYWRVYFDDDVFVTLTFTME